jgi:hypothetical protein
MLCKDKFVNQYWCLEESDEVYWYADVNNISKLSTPFGSLERIREGKIILLGPVCLGFWRG